MSPGLVMVLLMVSWDHANMCVKDNLINPLSNIESIVKLTIFEYLNKKRRN